MFNRASEVSLHFERDFKRIFGNFCYTFLLQKAKSENEFDREILLNQELKKLNLETKEAELEIDRLVYELYDLSLEEIGIIETM